MLWRACSVQRAPGLCWTACMHACQRRIAGVARQQCCLPDVKNGWVVLPLASALLPVAALLLLLLLTFQCCVRACWLGGCYVK